VVPALADTQIRPDPAYDYLYRPAPERPARQPKPSRALRGDPPQGTGALGQLKTEERKTVSTETTTPTTPPAPAPRKPRRGKFIRRVAATALGVIIAVWVISALASSGTSPRTHKVAQAPASSAPAAQPSQPAAPPEQAKKVTFIIKGNVPASEFGEVDITYGSDTVTHDITLPNLDAQGVTVSMPYDPSALYYAGDAVFTSAGSATVQIVISGQSMNPTVVAKGSATSTDNGSGTGGSGGDARAQAAPNDQAGTNWSQE
jgi:hypothetical protein